MELRLLVEAHCGLDRPRELGVPDKGGGKPDALRGLDFFLDPPDLRVGLLLLGALTLARLASAFSMPQPGRRYGRARRWVLMPMSGRPDRT